MNDAREVLDDARLLISQIERFGAQAEQVLTLARLVERLAGGAAETAPNQSVSPASQPVYVALFRHGRFLRLTIEESMVVANAFVNGWWDCAESLRAMADPHEPAVAYVLPGSEDAMREHVPHAEADKAMKAWADAVQSDGVAEQKDGPQKPAMAPSDNPAVTALQNHLLEVELARHEAIVRGDSKDALIRDVEADEIRRCITIVRKALE